MLIKRPRSADIPGSEITPHHVFVSRRLFMHQITAGALVSSSLVTEAMAAESSARLILRMQQKMHQQNLRMRAPTIISTNSVPTRVIQCYMRAP